MRPAWLEQWRSTKANKAVWRPYSMGFSTHFVGISSFVDAKLWALVTLGSFLTF